MVARRPRVVEPSQGEPAVNDDDAEWVVYRVGDGAERAFLDMAKGHLWDAHVKRMEENGQPLSLTLLARGLTHKQAKQFVELSKEEV